MEIFSRGCSQSSHSSAVGPQCCLCLWRAILGSKQEERRSQGKQLQAVTPGEPGRLRGLSPRTLGAPAVAPRGTSDPAGPHAAALSSTAPRPRARGAPSSDPRPAPPRPASVPTPGPPHRPIVRSRESRGRHGAGKRIHRQLAPEAMARRLLRSPAGSLGCPEPAVHSAAPLRGPGAGGREATRREEAAEEEACGPALRQPGVSPSLSPNAEFGATAPARPAFPRGHMAWLCALLSCLLPLHCALCAAAGSRTPGACGPGALQRVGDGVRAGPGDQRCRKAA